MGWAGRLPAPELLLRASVVVIGVLGAAEQVRHTRRRMDRRLRSTVDDIEHAVWKLLLRRTLDMLAVELIPMALDARKERRA